MFTIFNKMDANLMTVFKHAEERLKEKYPCYKIYFYNTLGRYDIASKQSMTLDIIYNDTNVTFQYDEDLNPWSSTIEPLKLQLTKTYEIGDKGKYRNPLPGFIDIPIPVKCFDTVMKNLDINIIFNEIQDINDLMASRETIEPHGFLALTQATYRKIAFLLDLAKIPEDENIHTKIRRP